MSESIKELSLADLFESQDGCSEEAADIWRAIKCKKDIAPIPLEDIVPPEVKEEARTGHIQHLACEKEHLMPMKEKVARYTKFHRNGEEQFLGGRTKE